MDGRGGGTEEVPPERRNEMRRCFPVSCSLTNQSWRNQRLDGVFRNAGRAMRNPHDQLPDGLLGDEAALMIKSSR